MNISKLKPLDEKMFMKILKRYEKIVTMEENVKMGGFGSAILEFASDHSFKSDILRITLGNIFVEHGTRPYLYKKYNIDEASVIKSMKERWPNLKIK
jgi:1-deoxy-D-xylulose-5-phosphate synthase